MINILMNGCNGKMGQVITRLSKEHPDMQIVAGVDKNPELHANPYPVFESLQSVQDIRVDVVLDFSHPSTLPSLIAFCLEREAALVVGTTGLSEADYGQMRQASERMAVFTSANMSYGVAVFMDLAVKAAAALAETFDIEMLEKHHNEKKDAPSGTALMVANAINEQLNHSMQYVFDRSEVTEKRKKNEIGISSIRGGTIPGEHTVYYAGKDEIIEIRHSALSRDIFGRGALRAARYIVTKEKGFYNMKSMLKELI